MKKIFANLKDFVAAVIIGAAFEYDEEKAVYLKVRAAEEAKKRRDNPPPLGKKGVAYRNRNAPKNKPAGKVLQPNP